VRLVNIRMRGSQTSDGQLPLGTRYWLTERAFRQGDVPAVRRFTQAFGARAGVAAERLADFVLAVSEATACTTAVGPCTPRVRLWLTGPRAFCEVRGNGMLLRRSVRGTQPYGRPGEEEAMRRWVLKQLSDYVCVASGPDGVRVLLSMRVA
jgi:serine/threonine-protein kinase RsbW